RHAARRIASHQTLEVARLRGSDRGVALVVQYEDLDGQTVTPDRFQLLDVELKASVAIDTDGPAPTSCEACPDRGGKGKAHRSSAPVVKHALVLLRLETEQKDLDSGTRGRRADDLALIELSREDLSERIRGHVVCPLVMLRQHDRIPALPLTHALKPSRGCAARPRAELTNELAEKSPRVGDDLHVDLHAHLFDLRGADIDQNFPRPPCEPIVRVGGERHVKASPDRQKQIAILQGEVCPAGGDRARAASEARMVLRKEIDAEPRRQDGNLDPRDQLRQLVEGACQANATPRYQNGPLSFRQERHHISDPRREVTHIPGESGMARIESLHARGVDL